MAPFPAEPVILIPRENQGALLHSPHWTPLGRKDILKLVLFALVALGIVLGVALAVFFIYRRRKGVTRTSRSLRPLMLSCQKRGSARSLVSSLNAVWGSPATVAEKPGAPDVREVKEVKKEESQPDPDHSGTDTDPESSSHSADSSSTSGCDTPLDSLGLSGSPPPPLACFHMGPVTSATLNDPEISNDSASVYSSDITDILDSFETPSPFLLPVKPLPVTLCSPVGLGISGLQTPAIVLEGCENVAEPASDPDVLSEKFLNAPPPMHTAEQRNTVHAAIKARIVNYRRARFEIQVPPSPKDKVVIRPFITGVDQSSHEAPSTAFPEKGKDVFCGYF